MFEVLLFCGGSKQYMYPKIYTLSKMYTPSKPKFYSLKVTFEGFSLQDMMFHFLSLIIKDEIVLIMWKTKVKYGLHILQHTRQHSIISIFKEDNVLSMTANLPYGPQMNTGIDFFWTFSYRTFSMLVVRFC